MYTEFGVDGGSRTMESVPDDEAELPMFAAAPGGMVSRGSRAKADSLHNLDRESRELLAAVS